MTASSQNRRSRREALLKAAVEVFGEKGYQAASVADILERADVARGTFYRYFDSKKDVFAAALDDFLGRMRGPLGELDIGRPMNEQELLALYRRVAGVLSERPEDREFARVVLSEGVGSERVFLRKLAAFYDEIEQMTASYLAAAMESGRARKLDPSVTARCIMGMVKEILLVWASERRADSDLPKMLTTAIEFGFYGLLPRGRT